MCSDNEREGSNMRMMAMKLDTLDDLLVHELKDLYSAEKMIIEALPKMIDTASSKELKRGFEKHLDQTKEQVSRLEHIFEMMDIEPEEEKCDGMAGIIKEGESVIKADGDPVVKDAAMIGAAQKVEHYEISAYGTARTFASMLGHEDIARELQKTLDQESKTDELLTQMAEGKINVQAAKK